MNLAQAIKQCSMDAWETSVPCDVMLGCVTGTDPLKITIGDMEIPTELLYVPEHLTYREEEIKFGVYERVIVINKGLSAGDEVIVMRKRGGGGYAVIGKL